jgi:hypothetical protein
VELSAYGVSAPGSVYEIGGQRFEAASCGFAEFIANAHAARQRPRCLCTPEGVEMYVARLAGPHGGYIVKRMPDTGCRHACDCPSFEPPADLSGLGQVLCTAINEDPATGQTSLTLGFSLTKLPGRSQLPPAGGESESAATDGTKLSLRGLLHYLWDQAELTRWYPGFAGKRTWATVRRHLLQAADHKLARGDALRARLYVPEPFSIDERDAINARRLMQWQQAVAVPGKPQQLMMLIGEAKEIVPSRYGFKAVIKHVPDQAFAIDEQLYRRLGRRYEPELELWSATGDIHMVMIATFGVSGLGVPSINELCLMPVTRQWLPVQDIYEKQLIERLTTEGRAFVKGLRYMLGSAASIVNATLLDIPDTTVELRIADRSHPNSLASADPNQAEVPDSEWTWNPVNGPMPVLPPPAVRRSQTGSSVPAS